MENYRGTVIENRGQTGELSFAEEASYLDSLLAANRKSAERKAIFKDAREELEASMMTRPISDRKALSYFGLLLGAFAPFSLIVKIFVVEGGNPDDIWFLALFLVANAVTAGMGFLTGSAVGNLLTSVKSYNWHSYILLTALSGVAWGIFSGGVGGIFLLIIGGLVGAIIGGMTAGIALPVYAAAHRLLARGNSIELKHFLPVSLGIVLTICAFILGL